MRVYTTYLDGLRDELGENKRGGDEIPAPPVCLISVLLLKNENKFNYDENRELLG